MAVSFYSNLDAYGGQFTVLGNYRVKLVYITEKVHPNKGLQLRFYGPEIQNRF